jgi:integrase
MPDYAIGRLRGGLVLVYRDEQGKRHRHSLGTTDPREAQHAAPSLYAELTRPTGTTVQDLWQGYTTDKAGRAVLATMEHTWKVLKDRFGPMAGNAVTIPDCRAHAAARRKAGIKDGTIHTELGHLRMVLKWAEDHRLIDRAPKIERPAKPKPSERHLTRDEMRRLLENVAFPHVRLFALLAYTTAGRSAAILDLKWNRVDFDRELIDLRNPLITTPHKGRAIVPMLRTAKVALLDARKASLSEFVVEWGQDRVSSVKRGLATAAKAAGLSKVTPHMLRHSAAVHMAEDGVSMDEVAQYLGHDDVATTRKVYARFSPGHLRRAAAALEYDDLGTLNRKRTSQGTAK